MQNHQINKIKNLVGIANKAGYVIFGADNLNGYNKKLYLLIKAKEVGNGIVKLWQRMLENPNIQHIELENDIVQQITNSENCRIFAIKNKGLADEIIKVIRGENIG